MIALKVDINGIRFTVDRISLFKILAQTGISGLWKIEVNRGLQREKKMICKGVYENIFLV